MAHLHEHITQKGHGKAFAIGIGLNIILQKNESCCCFFNKMEVQLSSDKKYFVYI